VCPKWQPSVPFIVHYFALVKRSALLREEGAIWEAFCDSVSHSNTAQRNMAFGNVYSVLTKR
jgi:hypothetical protein